MKYWAVLFSALLCMLFAGGCMRNKNDNPAYSAQPADTIQDLNFLD